MRHYEIMIILDPNLEERTVQPSLDQFLTVVTGGGGNVDKVDIWGKRRLAYQIEKKSEGIYAVVDLTAEPATVTGTRPSAQPERGRAADQGHAARASPLTAALPRPFPPAVRIVRIRSTPMAAGDTQITIAGNLVDDPELRFTPAGQPVARFRVASTPRFRDNATGEWKDGDSLFLTCNVWRQAAENVAESLTRGMRVIVSGRLRQRSYETKEGEKRTVYEVEVDDVGPSLRNASAKVNQVARSGGDGGYGGGQVVRRGPGRLRRRPVFRRRPGRLRRRRGRRPVGERQPRRLLRRAAVLGRPSRPIRTTPSPPAAGLC